MIPQILDSGPEAAQKPNRQNRRTRLVLKWSVLKGPPEILDNVSVAAEGPKWKNRRISLVLKCLVFQQSPYPGFWARGRREAELEESPYKPCVEMVCF